MATTSLLGKSKVWFFFTKSAGGKPIAKCNICNKECKTSGNTNNLIDHMRRLHRSEWDKAIQNEPSTSSGQRPLQLYFASKESYDVNSPRNKLLLHKLMGFITKDFQPFSIVEDTGFKEFVAELDSKFILPSRRHISDVMLPNLYENARKKLKDMLKNVELCSLTTDTWTSSITEGYITVTCHFIDCKKSMSAVISTKKIEGSHTADHLKNILSEIMIDWEISDKVSTIVTDNAANIVAAINLLKIKHMPCFAHTLNLVVKDALSKNGELKRLIKRIKDIITFFKSSTIASDKLRNFQQEKNMTEFRLIQSVSTRWNSEVAMIRRFLKLREMITIIIISLKNGPPATIVITSNEADILSEIVDILEPFENATTEISGDQYVTISLVIPLIHGIILKLDHLNSTIMTDVGKQILIELKESIVNRLFPYEKRTTAMVATLVDPRFKKSAFRVVENADNAQKFLTSEVSSYIATQPDDPVEYLTDSDDEPLEKRNRINSVAGGHGLLSFMQEKRAPIFRTSTSDANITIRQYIERPVNNQLSDPISFWLENKTQFPALSSIGLKYLIVPAASVPSERIFSAAGEILNDKRSRLKPHKVDMLVFLQKNQSFLNE